MTALQDAYINAKSTFDEHKHTLTQEQVVEVADMLLELLRKAVFNGIEEEKEEEDMAEYYMNENFD